MWTWTNRRMRRQFGTLNLIDGTKKGLQSTRRRTRTLNPKLWSTQKRLWKASILGRWTWRRSVCIPCTETFGYTYAIRLICRHRVPSSSLKTLHEYTAKRGKTLQSPEEHQERLSTTGSCIWIMGHDRRAVWSCMQSRVTAPTIGVGLMRKLEKHFVVALTPGAYTSKTCCHCLGQCRGRR